VSTKVNDIVEILEAAPGPWASLDAGAPAAAAVPVEDVPVVAVPIAKAPRAPRKPKTTAVATQVDAEAPAAAAAPAAAEDPAEWVDPEVVLVVAAAASFCLGLFFGSWFRSNVGIEAY